LPNCESFENPAETLNRGAYRILQYILYIHFRTVARTLIIAVTKFRYLHTSGLWCVRESRLLLWRNYFTSPI